MVQVRQRILRPCVLAAALLACAPAVPAGTAPRFYDDDPLWREPPPVPVAAVKRRSINEYYDFLRSTFFTPGKEIRKEGAVPPAGAVNTLGEVPDSSWYRNRDVKSMSLAELARGPGNSNPPEAPWTVTSGKTEGITPGLMIRDARSRLYLIKFDPPRFPELASAADVIGSKFFHALGYNVPENYIVRFTRDQLRVAPDASFVDRRGVERTMRERDVDDVLLKAPHDHNGHYRALASRYLEGRPIGPFRFHGVRRDDPNDIVPHEHRRDLRGLSVFAAWLNHTDAKSLNSLDTVVEENGVRYVRHHLLDFGAILGSDSFEAKSPRGGHVHLVELKPAAVQLASLGLYVPEWMRANYPDIRGVGRFESQAFDPERWRSNYPNPAFLNRLPDDAFWAAKKVMAFRDDQIRAMVETGEYSDPKAVDWIARHLAVRRDKIGRAFFGGVLPLDEFAVRNGKLEFTDLAAGYGFTAPRTFQVRWFRFDNDSREKTLIPGESFEVPVTLRTPGAYAAAEIRGPDPAKMVNVYLRSRNGGWEVVGIERTW